MRPRTNSRLRRSTAMAGAVLLLAGIGPRVAAVSAGDEQAARRVVAIGDIHGAYDELTTILQEAGLVDADLQWSGGDTILVQTGDFTDRGPRVRDCMDLLMRLQRQAPQQGGEVDVLLANHEVMNFVNFYRDTSPADFAAFVDEDSAERQERVWEEWMEFRRRRAAALAAPEPVFTDEVRARWEETHPPGFVERMAALGPDGLYGEWIRELPTAVEIDDVLFMHAGVSPDFADREPDEINELIWDEMETFDRIRARMIQERLITPHATLEEMVQGANDELARMLAESSSGAGRGPTPREVRFARDLESILNIAEWQFLAADGYLWFRGLAMWTEEQGEPLIAQVVEALDVSHIVVAHTTRPDARIAERFGGRVFVIDTGMLTEHYGGRPSALEIVDGVFTAIYEGERTVLYPPEPGDESSSTRNRWWLAPVPGRGPRP